MKKTLAIFIICLMLPYLIFAQKKNNKTNPTKSNVENKEEQKASSVKLVTKKDTVSYCLGMDVGLGVNNQISNGNLDIDPEIFLTGLTDLMKSGGTPAVTMEKYQEVVKRFQAEMKNKEKAAQKKDDEMKKGIADKNKANGDKFLKENRMKPGVKVTASGLQYKVIVEGKGKIPTDTSKVTVHYKGTTVDGKEFDNSYKRGEPITFPVNGVIKGWQEAMKMMPIGSKWELYIPPSLGYGENGAGNAIEPNAVLIFEVELISIN